MSESDSFIRAIREAPADDAPRLIYADWLEEHDDPETASLLCQQVAGTLLPPPPNPYIPVAEPAEDWYVPKPKDPNVNFSDPLAWQEVARRLRDDGDDEMAAVVATFYPAIQAELEAGSTIEAAVGKLVGNVTSLARLALSLKPKDG